MYFDTSKKRFPKHTAQTWIRDRFWNCRTKSELDSIMLSICTGYPELTTWLQIKRMPWIMIGLYHELSKIRREWRLLAHKHTELSQSSHYANKNIAGRKNNLHGAVLK